MDDKNKSKLAEYMHAHSQFVFAMFHDDRNGAAAARMRAHEALDTLLDQAAESVAQARRDTNHD